MHTRLKPIGMIASALVFLALAGAAVATTLNDVLVGIDSVKKPADLTSISFMGDLRVNLDEDTAPIVPRQANFLAAWKAPDEWFCTWELSGELATGLNSVGASGGHPAVDHVLLSRPDLMGILTFSWNAEYQGSAVWDGEPAWQLRFSPIDRTVDLPSFNMIIRKDDFVPLRTTVQFEDGPTATTDLTWTEIEGVLVPSKFTTRFNPAVGPLSGFETTFFNHDINPDLSGIEFPSEEGALLTGNDADIDEGPPVFEELYHGFADDPIVAPIEDSSGTYEKLSFTFSLYVEDPDVVDELDSRHGEIVDLAIDVLADWDWSGDDGLSTPSGKWDCGREIMDAINELFGTESITDFYFLDFEPE
jgi:hypothetical protein